MLPTDTRSETSIFLRSGRTTHYQLLYGILLTLVLVGCTTPAQPPTIPEPPMPTFLPTQAPTATTEAGNVRSNLPEVQDTGWLSGDPGVELRRINATTEDKVRRPLVLVRLDPRRIRVRVGYRPEQPRTLRSWFALEQPLLAINAGYFDANHQSTALVVSDGVASGTSYEGFGGMFAVHTDGIIELRPLRDAAYDPTEALAQATQSAPMLVFPGGIGADLAEDGERARRTVVAIDTLGRLLFVVTPTSVFTLSELEHWLIASDLQIDRALNLDGGSSTGMFLVSGDLQESIDSYAGLPLVILISH